MTYLGVESKNTAHIKVPRHPNIRVYLMSEVAPGFAQKLHYLIYTLWTLLWILVWRPNWIYVSDLLGAPIALLAKQITGIKVLYHEHDDNRQRDGKKTRFETYMGMCRNKLGRIADGCIIPQPERLNLFVTETGRTSPTFMVMNCPLKSEVASADHGTEPEHLKIYYHGSINSKRLPLTIIEAMKAFSGRVKLIFCGYETLNSRGYIEQFTDAAKRAGIGSSVEYKGNLNRDAMLRLCQTADVGLMFMPTQTDDPNMKYMAGASNKAFEYLAAGCPVIVNGSMEWQKMFVDPGFGLACDPEDVSSIRKVLQWCVDHGPSLKAMGDVGKNKILQDWNYETQFKDVEMMLG